MERIQGSPRVVSVSRAVCSGVPPKVVPLWVFIEWGKPRVLLMEWEFLGCKELMAIMGALKAMLCTQCHVTPQGKLHGQI